MTFDHWWAFRYCNGLPSQKHCKKPMGDYSQQAFFICYKQKESKEVIFYLMVFFYSEYQNKGVTAYQYLYEC